MEFGTACLKNFCKYLDPCSTYTLESHETCSSTMDLAHSYVREQHPFDKPHVVLSLGQTQGRGKVGRTWESPPGNLYCTFIVSTLEVGCSSQGLALYAYHMPFLVSVALGRALKSLGVVHALHYKWPNDLLVDGKKLGGILIERDILQDRSYYCIGMGVNLQNHPPSLPATCLRALGYKLSAYDLVKAFMEEWARVWSCYEREGFSGFRQEWLTHAYRLNCMISFSGAHKSHHGVFEGISLEGALILREGCGRKSLLYSGEISP